MVWKLDTYVNVIDLTKMIAAYFVQTLIETFEKDYQNCKDSIARGEDLTEEGAVGAKETKNLLTLAIELYNFQVIACVLVYDIIRILIEGLNEYDVELLMKIVTCESLKKNCGCG